MQLPEPFDSDNPEHRYLYAAALRHAADTWTSAHFIPVDQLRRLADEATS